MQRRVSVSAAESNDLELVDRLRGGDEAAVSDLASVYGSKIFQLAFRYTKNREDAEEIVQDVLMKVFRKIDAFRGDSALSSWIYRITFNTAMSRLRTSKAVRAFELEEAPVLEDAGQARRPEPPDWSNMADEQILRRQMRSRLARAVVQLPAIYRAPVILRDFHGLSTEEASVALRVKDQTLKSRLHRGRSILRRQLDDFASGLTMHRAVTPSALIPA